MLEVVIYDSVVCTTSKLKNLLETERKRTTPIEDIHSTVLVFLDASQVAVATRQRQGQLTPRLHKSALQPRIVEAVNLVAVFGFSLGHCNSLA